MLTEQDSKWMQRALTLASKAEQIGEVPVGAVIVLDGEVIAEGFNSSIQDHDPTAHAEMNALRHAAKHLENYRLLNTTLYVTLEPCLMCAGAMVHARIKSLVYGASDPKAGAIESAARVLDKPFLNHRVLYQGGLLAEPCGLILSQFFRGKR